MHAPYQQQPASIKEVCPNFNRLSRLTTLTTTLTLTTMPMTAAMMTTILVLEMPMRASRPTKAIKMVTKTTTKTKTMILLEFADPSTRTKGKQIGFLTMANLWQQDN